MNTMLMLAAAAGALQCPGSGIVEKAAPKPADKTMKAWVDVVNANTEGFTDTVAFEEGKPPRIRFPRRFIDFPGYTPMVVRSDDGTTLEMVKSMGVRFMKAEYNRLSGVLVITAPEGRWVGQCRRQASR
jgi:hypothetical protein